MSRNKELCQDITGWTLDETRSARLGDADGDIVLAVVQDRVVRYWHSAGLEDIVGPGQAPAEAYIRKMAKNAISTLITQQKRRLDMERVAANGGRLGEPLHDRPGVRRPVISLMTPDTAELAERHLLYDRALELAKTLPPGQKYDFLLFVKGMRPSEIAELREVSRQAVNESLRSAFAKIRKQLNG